MFGDAPLDFEGLAHRLGLASYAKVRSRVGDLPEVLGSLPASLMAKEITTPGKGQMRALFVSAGNPVLSVPERRRAGGGAGAARPLRLDRLLRLRHRPPRRLRAAGDDDVRARGLPAAVPAAVHDALHQHDRRGRRAGRGGTPGVGDHRADLEADRDRPLERRHRPGCSAGSGSGSRRSGWSTCCSAPAPRATCSGCAAAASASRSCGETRTESCSASTSQAGVMGKKVRHRDRRVHLDVPEIVAEAGRLAAQNGHDPDFPLRLIGLRELRSHNSWMHNAALLMRGGREHAARIHPEDGAAVAIDDGDTLPGLLAARLDRADRPPHRRGRSGARSRSRTGGATTAAGRPPMPPAARTSTCSPPRSPRTSSAWPGWPS